MLQPDSYSIVRFFWASIQMVRFFKVFSKELEKNREEKKLCLRAQQRFCANPRFAAYIFFKIYLPSIKWTSRVSCVSTSRHMFQDGFVPPCQARQGFTEPQYGILTCSSVIGWLWHLDISVSGFYLTGGGPCCSSIICLFLLMSQLWKLYILLHRRHRKSESISLLLIYHIKDVCVPIWHTFLVILFL
jgi:hypothetical protein